MAMARRRGRWRMRWISFNNDPVWRTRGKRRAGRNPMTTRPQLRTPDLVARYGFTAQHWIKLAAEGRIPGATQPCGPRGHWSFDAILFEEWWNAGKRGTKCQLSIGAEKHGGRAPSVKDESTVEASKQRIAQLLKSVSGTGSANLRRLRGATSRGGLGSKPPSASSKNTYPRLKLVRGSGTR